MFAASRGNTECCKKLTNCGALLADKTNSGLTAIDFATKGNHAETAKFLAERDAVDSKLMADTARLLTSKYNSVELGSVFATARTKNRKFKEALEKEGAKDLDEILEQVTEQFE